jgi:hypothetical protein
MVRIFTLYLYHQQRGNAKTLIKMNIETITLNENNTFEITDEVLAIMRLTMSRLIKFRAWNEYKSLIGDGRDEMVTEENSGLKSYQMRFRAIFYIIKRDAIHRTKRPSRG